MTPAAQLDQFRKWGTWAAAHPGLTPQQRKLAHGPETFHKLYERATVNGIAFTCESKEEKKKSKDSIIMIRLEGEPGAPPTPMFGRVQAFMELVRPGFGFHDAEAEMVTYVDAKWYKPPRSGTPGMNAEIGCPVVHTETHP